MPRTHAPILVLILLLGCAPEPNNTNPPASTLAQTVDALGGRASLEGLQRLRVEVMGSRKIDYEGLRPEELVDAATYAGTLLFDREADAMRLEFMRTPLFEAFQFFPPEAFSIIIRGDVGGLSAQAGFYPPVRYHPNTSPRPSNSSDS